MYVGLYLFCAKQVLNIYINIYLNTIRRPARKRVYSITITKLTLLISTGYNITIYVMLQLKEYACIPWEQWLPELQDLTNTAPRTTIDIPREQKRQCAC